MADDVIRMGVAGFGFGYHLVRALMGRDDCQVVAVADRSNKGLEDAAKRMRFTPYRDAVEMIRSADLDAVLIATSPKPRASMLLAAAERGLPMLVEKPWAADSDHARELADICRASAGPTMVAFSFRFHPAIVKLRELLNSSFGKPRMLNGQYVFDFVPDDDFWLWDPKSGNGFLNENSCHLFDAVCSLMGRPTRVYAEGEKFHGKPMEDAAVLTLRFENGSFATLTVGGVGTSGMDDFPRIDLFAEKGQALLQGREHIWTDLTWADADGTHRFHKHPEPIASTRYSAAYDHFFDCVRTGKQPEATIDDGILAVDIAMAAAESMRTGQPVSLPTE
ncbi:MAG: Gfo/Idh/MocA family oxidoreductase [Planctomycetota bacterium]